MKNVDALASSLIVRAYVDEGVRIDMDYAQRYITACEMLQKFPDNVASRKIIEHFQLLMSPFGRFTLPHEDYHLHCGDGSDETDEEYADRMLAHFARIPPLEIVNKCASYFRPHAEKLGWTEGVFGFMERTGLTVEQIRALSPAELSAYA